MTSPEPALEPRLFVVRAGKHNEVLDLFFEQELVGIGWDALGDIGTTAEEDLRAALEEHYPDSVQSSLGSLTAFKSMRPGDRVITPITSQGVFAVGEVTGGYSYDANRHELAVHAVPVTWINTAVPRPLLGQLRTRVDRQPTAHRITTPGAAALVDNMLQSLEPIAIPSDLTETVFSELLEAVLASIEAGDKAWTRRAGESAFIELRNLVGDSANPGGFRHVSTDVPAIVVGLSDLAFPVVLFSSDGQRVYFALAQATGELSDASGPERNVFRKRTLDLQAAAGISDSGPEILLVPGTDKPQRYTIGSAVAIQYPKGEIPPDAVLRDDLSELFAFANEATVAGLKFDLNREPWHLLFKWSRDFEPETIPRHRAIADSKGSVWWGKFGTAAMSSSKEAALRSQLDAGVPTHAYLYGDKTLVRTRLVDFTTDAESVAEGDIPPYYSKDDCSLFVRLTDFEDLPAGWGIDHLLVGSNPEPDAIRSALGNQTTPLFVFERFVPAATPEAPAGLSWDWLEQSTLWETSALEEILSALDPATGKGQVILAGPPGTGKTWVAKAIARYITEDVPLQYKVVQFHPSYGYEEFVEGIRPVASESGAIEFAPVKGTLLRLCDEMGDGEAQHVLIIDELNRANIPRVFGELLYLLEYRDEEIDLQYSAGFKLPRNLRIIATMNTADRSVRSIDAALRRRFEVFDCPADGQVLRRYQEQPGNDPGVSGLAEGFEQLNTELTLALDKHHTIGQSFFMEPEFDATRLRRVWDRQILPLIEDYFFDQPDVVAEFTVARFWPQA